MPLPPNSTISLQGHSRPGEGVTTMPKIAMVIRMTDETLDALQSLSGADRMDFEFGDKPGIYIHDQFFPMRYDREKENQELFIRTTTAVRPNAPLKLNANVVGKFAMEHVLSDKVTQRVHNATAAATKQKAERKAIMIDAPPAATSLTQKSAPKKKAPPKSTPRSSTPTIVKSYVTSSSQQASSTTGMPAQQRPIELGPMYRQRLIHYLALGAATVQDIFKEFGGSDADHTVRSGIVDLLNEVAEKEQVPRKAASSSQAAKWQLKPQTWLEVRPYQYSGYTDNVRLKVARTARTWLASLKIPESDPAWHHVNFRDSGHSVNNLNSNNAQRIANGTTSAKARNSKGSKTRDADTKAAPNPAPSSRPVPATVAASVPVKVNPPLERVVEPQRSAKGKERGTDTEKEEGELSASQTPPRIPPTSDRRQPASRPNGSSTPLMQPPPVPVSPRTSQVPSMPIKRTGPVDARMSKRAVPEPGERARAAPPIPPPIPADRKTVPQPKREMSQTKKERTSIVGGESGVPSGLPIRSSKDRDVSRREKERERESDLESLRTGRRETDRESDRDSIRTRDRDRLVKERKLEREREGKQGRLKEKVKEKEQLPSRQNVPSAKRKPSESSDEESSDWGYEERKNIRKSSLAASNPSSSKVKRDRDGVPMKTSISSLKSVSRDSPPPKQKIKREPSPSLVKTKLIIDRKSAVGSSSSVPKILKKDVKGEIASRSTNGKSLKRQRASIDFTSSSEEEEVPAPKSSRPAMKATASSNTATAKNPNAASIASEHRSRPAKQTKREQLRSRYSKIYGEYIAVFQKLVTQKSRFDAILRYGSESASELSDNDMDTVDLEEVEELRKRYQDLHDELEDIRKVYSA